MFIARKPGLQYVLRHNPAAWDKQIVDFIADFTWRNMDLSAIVPANACLVCLTTNIAAATAAKLLEIRPQGESQVFNRNMVQTQVPYVSNQGQHIVAISSTGIVEYRLTNSIDWSVIRLVVTGWFV